MIARRCQHTGHAIGLEQGLVLVFEALISVTSCATRTRVRQSAQQTTTRRAVTMTLPTCGVLFRSVCESTRYSSQWVKRTTPTLLTWVTWVTWVTRLFPNSNLKQPRQREPRLLERGLHVEHSSEVCRPSPIRGSPSMDLVKMNLHLEEERGRRFVCRSVQSLRQADRYSI